MPVSCLAVIQGASLRAVWNKQLHRVIGSGVGLLVAWGVLLIPLDKWTIPLIMMGLSFVVENAVCPPSFAEVVMGCNTRDRGNRNPACLE